jgi:hypothetical protein
VHERRRVQCIQRKQNGSEDVRGNLLRGGGVGDTGLRQHLWDAPVLAQIRNDPRLAPRRRPDAMVLHQRGVPHGRHEPADGVTQRRGQPAANRHNLHRDGRRADLRQHRLVRNGRANDDSMRPPSRRAEDTAGVKEVRRLGHFARALPARRRAPPRRVCRFRLFRAATGRLIGYERDASALQRPASGRVNATVYAPSD